MLRRVASNIVIFSEKVQYTNHVLELFNSRVVNHYPLRGEIAMTEWLGGTIIVENGKAYLFTEQADGIERLRLL